LAVASRAFEVFLCAWSLPESTDPAHTAFLRCPKASKSTMQPRPASVLPPRPTTYNSQNPRVPLAALLAFDVETSSWAAWNRTRKRALSPTAPVIRWPRRVSSSRYPSIGSPLLPSTPGQCSEEHQPSARPCQRTGPVPPSWFLTTSTVYSGIAAQVLLQPAADPGVHRVSCPSPPARPLPKEKTASTLPNLHTMHSPLKELPISSAILAHPIEPESSMCHARTLPPCR
jgi:hypothetical protein